MTGTFPYQPVYFVLFEENINVGDGGQAQVQSF